MKRYYLLFLLSYLVNTLNVHAQNNAQPQKKYNVIFIIIDDLSIAFEGYGNPEAPTPNFMRLMQHGVMFKETYCQYPLCSPSRTSLYAGKRPDATGVFDNQTDIRWKLGENYRFLPEYFHDYGYRTESIGKLGPCFHDDQVSWDYRFRAERDKGDFNHTPAWYIDTVHKNIKSTMDGIHVDTFLVRLRHPVANTYFYGLGLSTHNPFTPTLKSWNMTGDSTKKEWLPVDRNGTITDIKGNHSRTITYPDTPPDDTADIPSPALKKLFNFSHMEVKDLRHAYYAEIIEMDEHLGRVLDELDRLNLWHNSIVVFVSDHGVHLGEHQGLWLKNTIFEESIRVPFVICAPGKTKGAICTKPVEMVDIFPTLTELCGLPEHKGMQGSSLVPLLENPDADWKEAIFSQTGFGTSGDKKMGTAVRTGRYHYNNWLNAGEELYDIVDDPREYNNLVGDSAYEDVLKRMRRLFEKGWRDVLPPSFAKIPYYKDADGDGYGNSRESVVAYFKPDGYVAKGGDCDDNNKEVYSGDATPCNTSELKKELSSEKLSLSPNPSSGSVTVKYNSKNASNIDLKIFDLAGKVVLSKTENAIVGNNSYRLNVSYLNPGIYNLELKDGISLQRTKLIIEK